MDVSELPPEPKEEATVAPELTLEPEPARKPESGAVAALRCASQDSS
jgi:hypothetical protein